MSLSQWPPNQAMVARQTFFTLLIIALVGLTCGPLFFFKGIDANNRDRPSLQWPRTTGKMMLCYQIYHPGGRHSSSTYSIAATYAYVLDNHRYFGHQIALWSPDLQGKTGNFVAMHPINSPVDVYYDPQNPENAVLIPGADEWNNRVFIDGGSVLFVLGIIMVFRLPSKFAAYKALMN